MKTSDEPDTDQLIRLAAVGDDRARHQLLDRHRQRLRKAIACRLDRRLTARLDPSDVVQETLVEATARLSDYLRQQPLPFYPWLRRLARQKLADLYREHVEAGRRSVRREEPWNLALPDRSALQLINRLFSNGTGPSHALDRKELQQTVRRALEQLDPRDRDVLVFRHLEQLSTAETAAVLDLTPDAVRARHRRALERLSELLGRQGEGGPP